MMIEKDSILTQTIYRENLHYSIPGIAQLNCCMTEWLMYLNGSVCMYDLIMTMMYLLLWMRPPFFFFYVLFCFF